MDSQPDQYVDHINHNKLDNRRANLRIVTRAMNLQNRSGAQYISKTGIRGVHRNPNSPKKWRAQATVDRQKYSLGYFDSIVEAERVVVAWRLANMPGATS
jgi:hypothetical protein